MLAAFLIHQMTINNTKRRNAAGMQSNSPEKPDQLSSQAEICRTCLGTTNLRLIFCNSDVEQMSHKLKVVTNLEIKKNDALPQKICKKCLKIIDTTLDFRIKCREVEKNLLEMVKKNIKTESNNVHKFPKQSLSQYHVKTVKMEYDGAKSDGYQQDAEVEILPDIKPNIHRPTEQKVQYIVSAEKLFHTNRKNLADLPVNWDNNISNRDVKNPPIWNRNIPIRDVISKPAKAFPNTTAERKKKFREKMKLQKAIVIQTFQVKNAVRILDKKKYKAEKEEKKKTQITVTEPKVCVRRIRRTYTRLPSITGPPYACATCTKEYQSRTTYVAHVRSHATYVVCEECGKRFRNKFAMLIHQRAMHGLPKIYNCNHCAYSAANKDAMTVHGRRHTGERPFVCDHCGAGFFTRRTLIQHFGIHMPYTIQCPFCPKKLRSLRMLSNHKAKLHGKQYSYQCPYCPKAFKGLNNARKHIVRIHDIPCKEQPRIQKTFLYSVRQHQPKNIVT